MVLHSPQISIVFVLDVRPLFLHNFGNCPCLLFDAIVDFTACRLSAVWTVFSVQMQTPLIFATHFVALRKSFFFSFFLKFCTSFRGDLFSM